MTTDQLSSHQREILEALADRWELLRWRCNDGSHRWHMGDMEVDGRAVRGLWLRGLIEIDMLRHRLPSGVLTERGREALTVPATTPPHASAAAVGGGEAT